MITAAPGQHDEMEGTPQGFSSHRPVNLEIDLSAVAHNARLVKELIGSRCELMAVVKAGGYGLGGRWIAAGALLGGATRLGLACVDEGVQLRLDGFNCPVLVMGYAAPAEFEAAIKHGLTLTLHSGEMAQALDRAAASLGMPPASVPVHLKIDTGLHRYGCSLDDLGSVAQQLIACKHLKCEALMTHFADADGSDLTFVRTQLSRFHDAASQLRTLGLQFDFMHAANSAATLALPEARLDMVRVGIMLSGHFPSDVVAGKLNLRPVARLVASLARISSIAPGESVGYGRTWTASEPTRMGLVPLGYADGFRRAYSNRAEVLVGGRRCAVLGRVSMDQLTVDLTGVPGAREGDDVVLVGSQGAETITFDDLAAWDGTISYEILCGLSRRIPRTYLYGARVIGECDLRGCREAETWEGTR